MTSLRRRLELQRDWARTETCDAATGGAKAYARACDLGIACAKTMWGAQESHAQAAE